MLERVENEYSLSLAGEPVDFYLSSGTYDDYVELVLPDGASLRDDQRERLAGLTRQSDAGSVDVWVSSESRPIVSVTCLYIGTTDDLSLGRETRLGGVIADLAAAPPDVDFTALAQRLGRVSGMPSIDPPANSAPLGSELAGEQVACRSLGETRSATAEPAVDRLALLGAPLGRADRQAARGQTHKALRSVEEALRAYPNHPLALEYRDKLVLLIRRVKRQERERKNVQAQLGAGFSYLVTGCDPLAIAALGEALRLQPGFFLAQLLLGVAYHHQGRIAEARLACEAAQRSQPENSAPRDLLDALVRGELPPLPVEDEKPRRSRPVSYYHQRWATAG